MFLCYRHLVFVDGSGTAADHHYSDLNRWRVALYHGMRRHSNRPLVERLPHIGIRDIADKIPRNNPSAVYQLDAFGLRFGGARVRVCSYALEITTNGYKQVFKIKWIPTYFGRPRPLLVCNECKGNYQLLYEYYGRWACRHCLKATYVSERISHKRQKKWKEAKQTIAKGKLPTGFDTRLLAYYIQ